jgi:flagellar assembly protein FliH
MSNSPLSHENVSSLIDHVLKSKDPATVGIRKILKNKEDESKEFAYHAPQLKEFDIPGKQSARLSEEETIILNLEKKVHQLELQLKKQDDDSKVAIKNSFLKGRDDGYAEGVKTGKDETTVAFEIKIDEIQKKVATILETVENEKKQIYTNADHVLLKLSMEIAKKVVNCDVKVNKDIVLSVIRNALGYIGDKERIVIRVSPEDFDDVAGRKDFWTPVTDRMRNISIEADERIQIGGCIIESNAGMVDARLGVQFDELSEIVEKYWESSSGPALNNSSDTISD